MGSSIQSTFLTATRYCACWFTKLCGYLPRKIFRRNQNRRYLPKKFFIERERCRLRPDWSLFLNLYPWLEGVMIGRIKVRAPYKLLSGYHRKRESCQLVGVECILSQVLMRRIRNQKILTQSHEGTKRFFLAYYWSNSQPANRSDQRTSSQLGEKWQAKILALQRLRNDLWHRIFCTLKLKANCLFGFSSRHYSGKCVSESRESDPGQGDGCSLRIL